jgi:two-component system response regulator FixJ
VTFVHIIDDDDVLRDALARLIARHGEWQVTQWRSGEAFLAQRGCLEGGVLLLDHDMPGTKGIDVLAAVKGDPRFAAVMMTGAADTRLAVAAFRHGTIDMIEKPCDHELLIAALAAAAAVVETARPVAVARDLIARLSPRERDVLDGLVAGWPNKVIAYAYGISPRTAEVYRANLMIKLGVRSLSAALHIAFTAGRMPARERMNEPLALAA